MKKATALLSILILVFVFASISAAARVLTPEELKGGKIITADEAKTLLDSKKAVFIDMRKALNYGKGHVPGAFSSPYKGKSKKVVDFDSSLDSFDRSNIPASKSTAVIFYSDGPTGWKSYKAARTLIAEGYTNIKWFRTGFKSWKESGKPIQK